MSTLREYAQQRAPRSVVQAVRTRRAVRGDLRLRLLADLGDAKCLV